MKNNEHSQMRDMKQLTSSLLFFLASTITNDLLTVREITVRDNGKLK